MPASSERLWFWRAFMWCFRKCRNIPHSEKHCVGRKTPRTSNRCPCQFYSPCISSGDGYWPLTASRTLRDLWRIDPTVLLNQCINLWLCAPRVQSKVKVCKGQGSSLLRKRSALTLCPASLPFARVASNLRFPLRLSNRRQRQSLVAAWFLTNRTHHSRDVR